MLLSLVYDSIVEPLLIMGDYFDLIYYFSKLKLKMIDFKEFDNIYKSNALRY